MKKFIAILILVYLTIIVLPMLAQAAPAHQHRIQASRKADDKKFLQWNQGNKYRHVKYRPCLAENSKQTGAHKRNSQGNPKGSLIFGKNKTKN